MIKSFKIRIYPTKEQEKSLIDHINACRFVWNYMINEQRLSYENESKTLTHFDMVYMIKDLKKENDWLKNISSGSLSLVCRDVKNAYNRFFKKIANLPHFKSKKKAKMSYPVRYDKFYFKNGKARIEIVGFVKYKSDFKFSEGREFKFLSPRVSYLDGKWFVSFGMEYEKQILSKTEINMGIDLGIKQLAVVFFGTEKILYDNINKSHKIKCIKNKIKFYQRVISRKYEYNKIGNRYIKTNNIIKYENKVRRLYRKMHNIRNNYIHSITHYLVKLYPKTVIMEDLDVTGLLKNKHISPLIHEQCFHEFIRQMKYKCEWNEIEFVQADRFYPSSKTCSNCGNIKKDLKLSDRVYKCEECGLEIDRDFNAAINLMRYVD